MKERFKSPVLWLAIAALVAFIAKDWCGFEIPQFDEFVELFLAVLAGFGIVNNPTDKDNF